MQIRALGGGRASGIDGDDARPAFSPRHLQALIEDRMAPRGVGAREDHEVGRVEILIGLRHHVGPERAALSGDSGGHAQPRVGVDVRCADEALGQLVGDVIVLGEELSREIERDRTRPVRIADAIELRCYMVQRFVPACLLSPDHRVEQTRFQAERLAERGPFRTQPPEVGGMRRVSRDGRAAFAVRLGQHAATDAAVRASGSNRGGSAVCHQ